MDIFEKMKEEQRKLDEPCLNNPNKTCNHCNDKCRELREVFKATEEGCRKDCPLVIDKEG